jgi:hypothetical protein
VSALHPTTVDVLVSMRKPHLLKKAFAELPENITERQVMYAAKLIDAIRSGPLEILNEGSARLGKWSQSKLPLLAVAAQAAMVRLNQAGKAQFNKTLLRIARADKSNAIGFWLENNSEIIDLIDIERLPARTWKYLLACYAVREPNKVEKLLASHIKGAHRSKYLKEAIQALSTVQSPNADFILESLLGRELHKGIDDELRKDESIARVVRKYFWLIMETIEEPAKLELFDAITSKIEVRETFSFLQSGVNQGHRQSNEALLNCIASAFVPRALSKGRIGSAEVQQFSDDLFKQTIAFSLVEQSMKDWVFLTHFPGAWQTRRTELKKHISSRVETGLQIGLLNSQRDSALRSNLERLVRDVRSWIDRDSPAIDRSLEIAQNMGIPQKLSENVPTLETFFLRQPSHPQELILFLAQNGWALPYLATQRGAWPTFNVILDQLTKSFVFIKGLRTRGEAEIADLNTSILTDLAISIRSSVSNIEEQLAGYFAFRQILSELGIQPVSAELGAAVSENELGTEEGRSLREPGRQGKYRIFSLGMKVKKKVVDVAIAAKSGVEDDRD